MHHQRLIQNPAHHAARAAHQNQNASSDHASLKRGHEYVGKGISQRMRAKMPQNPRFHAE